MTLHSYCVFMWHKQIMAELCSYFSSVFVGILYYNISPSFFLLITDKCFYNRFFFFLQGTGLAFIVMAEVFVQVK
jgi:hypothetical protein